MAAEVSSEGGEKRSRRSARGQWKEGAVDEAAAAARAGDGSLAALATEFDGRWRAWHETQPLSVQLALGGRGWPGILLVRLPRLLGKFVLGAAAVVLVLGGIWLGVSWNTPLQTRFLGQRLVHSFGAESVEVSGSRWRGRNLGLGAVEASWAAPTSVARVEATGIAVRRMPWEILRSSWALDKVSLDRLEVALRVGSGEVGESGGGTEGAGPVPLARSQRRHGWGVDLLEANKVHLHWRAGELTDGELRGTTLRARRQRQLEPEGATQPGAGAESSDAERGVGHLGMEVSLDTVTGRIGWLQDLRAPELRLREVSAGRWAAKLEETTWRDAVLDFHLDARVSRGLELDGEVHWRQLPLTTLGRCRDFGIDFGVLTGVNRLSMNFARFDGMRLSGDFQVLPQNPVRWIDHPLAKTLTRLLPRAEAGNLTFLDGSLHFSGDGIQWVVDGVNFDTRRGLAVGGEIRIADPLRSARGLGDTAWHRNSAKRRGGDAGDGEQAEFDLAPDPAQPGLFRDIENQLATAAERTEALRRSVENMDAQQRGETPPTQRVTMGGSIWVALDPQRVDPALRAALEAELGARLVDGQLRLEHSFDGLESCREIGVAWAQQIEQVAAEVDRQKLARN